MIRPTSRHSIAQLARIVLLAADALSNNEVADSGRMQPGDTFKLSENPRFVDKVGDAVACTLNPPEPMSADQLSTRGCTASESVSLRFPEAWSTNR